jgi:hypothetical protein
VTEPDVTLTDYVLAVEGAILALFVCRTNSGQPVLRVWLPIFFASVSAASLFGGTVHGFFLDEQSLGQAILWPATLTATGVAAAATWVIGASLLFSTRIVKWVAAAAVAQFALFSAAVLFLTTDFRLAVLGYFPGSLFVLIALCLAYRRTKDGNLGFAACGVALTIGGAVLQQLGIGIHPVYFNHNALYHVLQAVALLLIFRMGYWSGSEEMVYYEREPVDSQPSVLS